MSNDSNAGWYSFQIIFNLILTTISLVLLVIFNIQINKSSDRKKNNKKLSNITVRILSHAIFVIAFLLFFELLFTSGGSVLFNYYTISHKSCDIEIKLRILTFIIFEHTLFLFWWQRINIAFHGSIFCLSKLQNRIFFSAIIISFIIFSIIGIVPLHGELYQINIKISSDHSDVEYSLVCRPSSHDKSILYLNTLTGSLVIIILNLVFASIFISKLRQVSALRYNNDIDPNISPKSPKSESRLNNVFELAEKNTILTITTVFTTFILWISFSFITIGSEYYDSFTWLLALDVFCNLICVYLMFGFTKKYYNKCMKCYPYGNICRKLMSWIEQYKLKKSIQKWTVDTIFNNVLQEQKSVNSIEIESPRSISDHD